MLSAEITVHPEQIIVFQYGSLLNQSVYFDCCKTLPLTTFQNMKSHHIKRKKKKKFLLDNSCSMPIYEFSARVKAFFF